MRLAMMAAVLDNRDADTVADVRTSGTSSPPKELLAQRQPADPCQGNLLPHRDRRHVQTQVRDHGLGRRALLITSCSLLVLILFLLSSTNSRSLSLLAAIFQFRSQPGFSIDHFTLFMIIGPSRFVWVRPLDAMILIAYLNRQRWICR